MKYIMKKLLAGVLSLSLTLGVTACSNAEKEKKEEDTTPERLEELMDNQYDWDIVLESSKGSGGERAGTTPDYYLRSDSTIKISQSNSVKDGIRVMSEKVKLTGLLDATIMSTINEVVGTAHKNLEGDHSWVSEEEISGLKNKYGKNARVEPLNFVSSAATVFGHVYSVDIIYIHSYQISNEEKVHIEEETVAEGRVLFNFDLRTGGVLELSDLFYNDVDYITLLTEQMKRIGEQLEYRFVREIRGLPEQYDMFCIAGDGLVIGLPEGNCYTEEETWYSIKLSDIIGEITVDPQAVVSLFHESIVFEKNAFDVANISYQEYQQNPPYDGEIVVFPLVFGIPASEEINQDLKAWYEEITQADYYTGIDLTNGGSFSVEIAAPCNMVNVTVFAYFSAENRYLTLARCYHADTGKIVKAGELIVGPIRNELPSEALETTNFRVGYDFTLGIPAQNGLTEDLVITEENLLFP